MNQTYLSKQFQRSLRPSYAFGQGTACTLSLASIGSVSITTRPSLTNVLIALSIGISTCKTPYIFFIFRLSAYLWTNIEYIHYKIIHSFSYLYFKCIIHESLTFVSNTSATSDLHLPHFLVIYICNHDINLENTRTEFPA